MRFKTRVQKNKMGKTNTTNASTNWVPTKFKQTDLTKALADGLIADGYRSSSLALNASPSHRAASG
jgi:hypothetical protein